MDSSIPTHASSNSQLSQWQYFMAFVQYLRHVLRYNFGHVRFLNVLKMEVQSLGNLLKS